METENDIAKLYELPAKMCDAVTASPEVPNKLKAEKHNLPELDASEIMVRVHAADINRSDVQQRKWACFAPLEAADLSFLEITGKIAALERRLIGTTRWRIAD